MGEKATEKEEEKLEKEEKIDNKLKSRRKTSERPSKTTTPTLLQSCKNSRPLNHKFNLPKPQDTPTTKSLSTHLLLQTFSPLSPWENIIQRINPYRTSRQDFWKSSRFSFETPVD